MIDGLTLKPPGRVRGRPFEKGRSGNPAGRRIGCRNKTTIAAAMNAATSAFETAEEIGRAPRSPAGPVLCVLRDSRCAASSE
jgi:hypothetical protein